jgi:hypothetical protein
MRDHMVLEGAESPLKVFRESRLTVLRSTLLQAIL